jgi:hypothetical protein
MMTYVFQNRRRADDMIVVAADNINHAYDNAFVTAFIDQADFKIFSINKIKWEDYKFPCFNHNQKANG